MNVVTTGLESGAAEWVKRFVVDKQHELKDESRADTINFCNALISYYERNYRASLTELSKVTTEDMTYKHNIRSLYLKLYFDMNEIEPFLSHIDSYKHFISKNPLVYGKIKDQVNNYINFSSRIFCIKNSIGKFDEFDVSRLRKELIECKSIINKSWLIERAEKLLKTQQI
jgi:hypothetical protein